MSFGEDFWFLGLSIFAGESAKMVCILPKAEIYPLCSSIGNMEIHEQISV
jgi:hypothetical protein